MVKRVIKLNNNLEFDFIMIDFYIVLLNKKSRSVHIEYLLFFQQPDIIKINCSLLFIIVINV